MLTLFATLIGALTGLAVHYEACHLVEEYRRRQSLPVPTWRCEDGRLRIALMVGFALFAVLWWSGHPTWPQTVSVLVVTALLVAITLVDLAVRRIPNQLVLTLFIWAVIQSLWTGRPSLPALAVGALVGGGLFLVIAIVGRGAMGMGDVKLAFALGAVLGYPAVLSALLTGIIAGGLAALILIVTRRIGRKDYMAYGPYLALGALLILLR